jgi:hypothetical protein
VPEAPVNEDRPRPPPIRNVRGPGKVTIAHSESGPQGVQLMPDNTFRGCVLLPDSAEPTRSHDINFEPIRVASLLGDCGHAGTSSRIRSR